MKTNNQIEPRLTRLRDCLGKVNFSLGIPDNDIDVARFTTRKPNSLLPISLHSQMSLVRNCFFFFSAGKLSKP